MMILYKELEQESRKSLGSSSAFFLDGSIRAFSLTIASIAAGLIKYDNRKRKSIVSRHMHPDCIFRERTVSLTSFYRHTDKFTIQ